MRAALRLATVLGAAAALALLPPFPALSETTLGTGHYRLVGTAFDVEPLTQAVPVGIPAVVRTVFTGPASGLGSGSVRVAAELTGPGLPSPITLTAAPGGDLVVPALSVRGEYRLDAIRLTDGARTLAPAAHASATLVVTDVLVSSITSRVLTPQELADRGVVVDERSFRAFSFAFALAIQGQTINVELPTVIEGASGYQPVEAPRVRVDNASERFQLPSVVPFRLDPVRPGGAEVPSGEPLDAPEVSVGQVYGVLLFPGNIKFLNQFFAVVLMVQNGSGAGTSLVLKDVTTTVGVPASALRVVATTPSVPDGQPIPVRGAGPDGVLGTPDDLVVLAAQQAGSTELVTEGLKVGTHEVTCDIDAVLDGLAGQAPVRLKGRARGSVLVRDPSFSLAFSHPDVVRSGEEYDLGVTVVNTSTVRANAVSLSIDAASITGAVPVGGVPGSDPVASLGDLLPGASAQATFRFQATKTGRVVASSFTSDGSVTGSLLLRTGVTNEGIPLSPDSFVFPRYVANLPAGVVAPATALIGIAHGQATADPSVPGSLTSARFADSVVQDRARELVMAARRAGLGQSVPSAVTDLLLQWLGATGDIPGFDAVRRVSLRGGELESGVAAVLGAHLSSGGVAALRQTLLDSAVATAPAFQPAAPVRGPVVAVLEAGSLPDPAARLLLSDRKTGASAARKPGEAGFVRDLPFGAVLSLASGSGAEVAAVGRIGDLGLDLVLEGRRSGTATLTLFYPDGRGGFLSVRFDAVPTSAGASASVRIVPGAPQLILEGATGGSRVAAAQPGAPTPFGALAAVQDLDASKLGKVVTLLFNRPLPDAAGSLALYRLPAPTAAGPVRDRRLVKARIQDDPRLLGLVADAVVSPTRPGSAVGSLVPGPSSSSWSGELPIAVRLNVPGGSVEGRVLGTDGTPLASAPVRLSEAATDDLSGQSFDATTAVTETDATGSFFFDFVRKQDGRPFRLDAYDPRSAAQGWAVGSIQASGQTVHVDVALQGRGTVRGSVKDGSGQLLGGIIVRCAPASDPSRATAQLTAADGSFSFSSVPVGTAQLQAEHPATNRTAYAAVLVGAPGAVSEAQLVLAPLPRASLSGKVVHGQGGAPYEAAWVAGYGQEGEYFGAKLTDAAGRFAFGSVPAGTVRLEVFDPVRSRDAAVVQSATLPRDGLVDVTVVVPETVPRFGSVSGTVLTTSSGVTSPLAGAIVFVDGVGLRTTTGPAGTFTVEGVPVGSRSVVALISSSGRSARVATAVQEGLVSTVQIVFGDSSLGTVRGSVVDQNGQPRAGARVEIWDAGPPLRLVAGATAAADGRFALDGVTPGTWRLQATSAETRHGVSLRNAGAAQVTVTGGGTASVTIALRGFVDVTGRVLARVRDRDGNLHDSPVHNGVELHSGRFNGFAPDDPSPDPTNPEAGRIFGDGPGFHSRRSSDPETGAFTFLAAHGGPLIVVARNPFYGDRTVSLGTVLGDTTRGPLDLVFDGNLGVVDGFLYDTSGAPVPGVRVALAPTGTGFDGLEALTRADGYFSFPLVPFSTQLRAVFSGPVAGVARYAEARGSVTPEAPQARLTLRLLPVGSVTVKVQTTTASGPLVVAGAQVRLDELSGPRRSFNATTDALGLASFHDVTGGSLAVVARKDLVSGRGATVGLGEGFRAEATLELAASATVQGTVRSPSGGPGVGGVNVVLDAGWPKGLVGAATTGADGSFAIHEVPAGDRTVYRLGAEDPRTLRAGQSPSFALAPAETRTVDVTFRALGNVTGRLTTFDGGTPIGGAPVEIRSRDDDGTTGPSVTVSTGPDGRYRAEGIRAGVVSVDAEAPVTHLTAHGNGRLTTEGETIAVDLRATPTGRVRGSVRQADGSALPAGPPPPEVRLSSGGNEQIQLATAYDFDGVDATRTFSLRASERAAPYHLGVSSGTSVAGGDTVVDVRYGAFGTVNVHVKKPDPAHPGSFLPALATVRVLSGVPYLYRFPSGGRLRTSASGDVTFTQVGFGFGVGISAEEEGTGAGGSVAVPEIGADGQTVDVTVVLAPRGLIRGRVLRPVPDQGQPAEAVQVDVWGGIGTSWGIVSSTVTGTDGRFQVSDVPLGPKVLVLKATAGTAAAARLSAALSEAAPLLDTGDLVLDAVPPAVASIVPPNGATGIGLSPTVTVTFSEPIVRDALAGPLASYVSLTGPAGAVGSIGPTLDATGRVLGFTPPGSLAGGTTYEVRVSGSVADLSGLPMGGDLVARFTTADLTAPTVVSSTPVPGQIQVRTDLNPTVVFTKPLDPASLASGVSLVRVDAPAGAQPLSPSLQADGKTVALNPAASLQGEAEYQIVLSSVRDLAGNLLPAPVAIRFFTRDDRSPVVTLDDPDTLTPGEGTAHAYTVRWNDDDVKTVGLRLVAATGEIPCGTVSPAREARSHAFSCTLPSITAAGGPALALRATSADQSGNVGAPVERVLTLGANVPPTVTLVAPAAGSHVRSGSPLPVRFDVADDRGVVEAVVSLGTASVTVASPPASASATLTVPSVAVSQALALTVTVRDGGGLTASASVSLVIDPDAPPAITLTEPVQGALAVSGSVLAVRGTLADDNNDAVLSVQLGAERRTVPTVGPFLVSIPAPVVSVSTASALQLSAVDGGGHAAVPISLSLTIDPDTTAPAVSIGSPAEQARFLSGRPIGLVATASDAVRVVSLRYRLGGGPWADVPGTSVAVSLTAPPVAVETPALLEVEARDGAGNVGTASRNLRIAPNQPPTVTVSSPAPASRLTAQQPFLVTGVAADDSSAPTVSATFHGVTQQATGTTFSFTFAAPAVSAETASAVTISGTDGEGNATVPRGIPVTIVPDAGGTPTIVLAPPAPEVLVAGETTGLVLTFADNVGLSSAWAEVTGGFTSSGRQTYALSGNSSTKTVPVASSEAPFGVPASVAARLEDVSARKASLETTLPVAYHRLAAPLAPGPYAEGSAVTATFAITPSGRVRASAVRLEIGTLSGEAFTALSCGQRPAPLGETEAVSVRVPTGASGLLLRSVLVEATGALAPAANDDGRTLFQRAISTVPDAASPTVHVENPLNGTTFNGGDTITVEVAAADDVALRSIEVTLDDPRTTMDEVTKACADSPCIVSFFAPAVAGDTGPIPFSIVAVAKDHAGHGATEAVTVHVNPSHAGSARATGTGEASGPDRRPPGEQPSEMEDRR